MTRAVAPFTLDVTSFDEPYATRDGVGYARAHFDKTFRGDLVASSSVEMLFVTAEEGRGYVALETIGQVAQTSSPAIVPQCRSANEPDLPPSDPSIVSSAT